MMSNGSKIGVRMMSSAAAAAAPHATRMTLHQLKQYGNYSVAALVPVALVLPSAAIYPLDLALGLVIPIHMHLGLSHVMHDYAPQHVAWGKYALLLTSVVTGLGLTKLNFEGPGISAGAVQLWKKN